MHKIAVKVNAPNVLCKLAGVLFFIFGNFSKFKSITVNMFRGLKVH
jgi:hypothetical protein